MYIYPLILNVKMYASSECENCYKYIVTIFTYELHHNITSYKYNEPTKALFMWSRYTGISRLHKTYFIPGLYDLGSPGCVYFIQKKRGKVNNNWLIKHNTNFVSHK